MEGDHYEEQLCPQCGLGMATECRGHENTKADRQVRAGEIMYRAGYIARLERQLSDAIRERDNAISDHKQADADTLRALNERNEARKERDAARTVARELIAAIRINHLRGMFKHATDEQIDQWIKPWVERIRP